MLQTISVFFQSNQILWAVLVELIILIAGVFLYLFWDKIIGVRRIRR